MSGVDVRGRWLADGLATGPSWPHCVPAAVAPASGSDVEIVTDPQDPDRYPSPEEIREALLPEQVAEFDAGRSTSLPVGVALAEEDVGLGTRDGHVRGCTGLRRRERRFESCRGRHL
jgi:hypothetical protein